MCSCGKFFEGTAQQMHHALFDVLGCLPHDTVRETHTPTLTYSLTHSLFFQLVFCGHEYSVNNLIYAQYVEPHNKAVTEKLEWSKVCTHTHTHTVQYVHT